ncbi:hypothetical protein [Kibdelosporangium aridum]|nr:hypothetical protein [Kibdelosporangium aridum]
MIRIQLGESTIDRTRIAMSQPAQRAGGWARAGAPGNGGRSATGI